MDSQNLKDKQCATVEVTYLFISSFAETFKTDDCISSVGAGMMTGLARQD